MLVPNARLRAAVTARANQAVDGVVAIPPVPEKRDASAESATARARSAAVLLWAALLARIYEAFPLVCSNCGGEVRLIAFITQRASVEQILTHFDEPTVPPTIAPARAPPGFEADYDQHPAWDAEVEPLPEIDFDQRQSW